MRGRQPSRFFRSAERARRHDAEVVAHELPDRTVETPCQRPSLRVRVHLVRFLEWASVDENGLVLHLHRLARKTDRPFDIEDLRVLRVFEDDNVSSFDPMGCCWRRGLSESVAHGELVNQESVADFDRRNHRRGRNGHGVHDVSRQKERKNRAHDRRHKVLTRGAVRLFLGSLLGILFSQFSS